MAADWNEDFTPALRDFVIDNIRIGNQIGRGANGRILEAKWEGVVVAIKEIHSIFINEMSDLEFRSFKRSFLHECEQSSRLRHPNVVRFFGIYHPPGARVPSLVMERLHCSLTSLLENNPVVPIGRKIWIIKDVALGLRYLHTRNPPIIHHDLSSNNVLLSKVMEGKIGDLGTARLVDPRRQSRMTKAPGTVDFMPPEALANVSSIHYGKELDVFSFSCVMLHTLSHEWPTPSEAVIINPDTGLVTGRTEVERRSQYLERIDRSRSDVLIPLIESCLSNLPKNRLSIVRVCEQLEGQLVDNEHTSGDELTVSALQQEIQLKEKEIQRKCVDIQLKDAEIQRLNTEIQRKNTEIQRNIIEIHRKDNEIQQKDAQLRGKDDEIQRNYSEIQRKDTEIQQLTTALQDKDVILETLKSDVSKLQITTSHSLPNKVNKSSSDFWNSLKLKWHYCASLPLKYYVTSVATLDGKVYVAIQNSGGAYCDPLMYDSDYNHWSALPKLPYVHFSLVTIPEYKQLLAIGGNEDNGTRKISNKVFLWDEENGKWTTPYPNMPTARYYCSSISHGSTVIVAGGVTCWEPWTMTRAVEVLHIKEHGWFTKSQWSVVEQLPHIVRNAVPMIFDDKIYIAVGYDEAHDDSFNIVTASLSELLQSSNKNTISGQVWYKLADMPYSSFSINHYHGRLITFGGCYRIERSNKEKPVWETVPLVHIYNPNTDTWDYVGKIPYEYSLGRSVHVRDDKTLFIGGLAGTCCADEYDDLISACSVLTLSLW